MPAASDPRQPLAPSWYLGDAGQAILASQWPAVRGLLDAHPAGSWLWLCVAECAAAEAGPLPGRGLRLRREHGGFGGALRCGLPLPLASQSLGCVVLQHVGDALDRDARAALLEECARVLLPDGQLAVLALNPAAPYRLRWQGSDARGAEPVTWRRRLRRAGLVPEAVTTGLGPRWQPQADPRPQEGAGMRACYLVRARKQVAALTPVRARPARLAIPATVPGA